jgi:hypothetical protein
MLTFKCCTGLACFLLDSRVSPSISSDGSKRDRNACFLCEGGVKSCVVNGVCRMICLANRYTYVFVHLLRCEKTRPTTPLLALQRRECPIPTIITIFSLSTCLLPPCDDLQAQQRNDLWNRDDTQGGCCGYAGKRDASWMNTGEKGKGMCVRDFNFVHLLFYLLSNIKLSTTADHSHSITINAHLNA